MVMDLTGPVGEVPFGSPPRDRGLRSGAVALAVAAVLALAAVLLAGNGTRGGGTDPGPSLTPVPDDPAAGGRFGLVAVGVALPSPAECERRVRRSTWEPRPANYLANRRTPRPPPVLALWPGFAEAARPLLERVTGDAEGTTDELIQWASCKWGFPDDVVRALAMAESGWEQAYVGDFTTDPRRCVTPYTAPCPTSFGLTQLKWFYMPGSYPWSQLSTAFNLDYALARLRACFEGHVTFFSGGYGPGDLWGCIGSHYSGDWKSPAAYAYLGRVRESLQARTWLHLGPDQRLLAPQPGHVPGTSRVEEAIRRG